MIDDEIAAAWHRADPERPQATVDHFAELLAAHPGEPRAVYEYASALDFAGREADAAPEYERALAAGLAPAIRRAALVQYASTLRNLDRADDAVRVLDGALAESPGDAAATAFQALALTSAGRAPAAVARLLEVLLDRLDDPSLQAYERPLRAYAADLEG